MANKKTRVYFLDEYRGLAIILMVIYHCTYNFVVVWGIDLPLFFSPFIIFLRDFFAASFIVLSGICCRFSKNNFKRGVLCFLCGIGVSMVTYLFVPQQIIVFGILHLLGISMIIFHLLKPILDKINLRLACIILAIFAVLTWNISKGYIGIGSFSLINLPYALYETDWFFALGIFSDNFYSADFFPLLPWLFLFLLGSYLGIPISKGEAPTFLYVKRNAFLGKVGQNTLYIYIIHQPIIYLLFKIFIR